MSELPSILVTDGWETDQNNKLTEIVIPSTVETLQVPTKITFKGTALNWIPSTAAVLQEFEAPNMLSIGKNTFSQWTALISVNMPALTSLDMGINGSGTFYGCTSLQTVRMDKLTACESNTGNINSYGAFRNCTSLTSVYMPLLASIKTYNNTAGAGMFYGCTGLQTISLPSLSSVIDPHYMSGTFYNCTSLQTVQLGSEGHPVSSLGSYTFNNCTQSGLTITIYTSDGNAISGSPWGATNATIVYEAA